MKIGIVGGGQLGRMLEQAGLLMGQGHTFTFLDPTPNCSAVRVGGEQIVGQYNDPDGLVELAKRSEVITFEIERVHDVMKGFDIPVFPSVNAITTIADKVVQKTFLRNRALPISSFQAVSSPGKVGELARHLDYPIMLKARRGGFDGRGNAKINSPQEIAPAWEDLTKRWGKLYVEQYVPFTKELSVIAVRDIYGNIVTYPTVETIHTNGICDLVISPARIRPEVDQAAQRLARRVITDLRIIGVLAIEMFYEELDEDNFFLWINELAPRVHNSGHWTIDGCDVSQFTNHIRAVTGQTVLEPQRTSAVTVMKNILGRIGEKEGEVPFPWPGLEEAQKVPGAIINLYDKDSRLDRKIGHINVPGDNDEDCMEIAETVRELIKV